MSAKRRGKLKPSRSTHARSGSVFHEPPRGDPAVSIIVPVADGDKEWLSLALDLTIVPADWEILFCGPEPVTRLEQQALSYLRRYADVRWIPSDRSRAGKLNLGGERAGGKVLWFVHADSRVDHRCFAAIEQRLPVMANTLLFFRLAFLKDGPNLTRINQFGAWFRSEILRLPFGDQGLCLDRSLWLKLGGFPENVPYGEDHLFVWRAHQAGIAVRPLAAKLYSSARKYRDQGWRQTTGRHLAITYHQALPELRLLVATTWRRWRGQLLGFGPKPGQVGESASEPLRAGASAAVPKPVHPQATLRPTKADTAAKDNL